MSTAILPPNYTLNSRHPTAEEYIHLRKASGLSPVTPAQATASIKGSWYGCYITYTPPNPNLNQSSVPAPVPVGMGRIISDGGWYFHIVDMAVLPDHQRKGLGNVILKTLLARIKELAPEGRPYVNLFADPPGRRLYAKNGFVEAASKEMGMVLKWDA
ncbi:GNAT family [Aspergillus sclerotialis]|uniref:GNAT family n=1 Tax=Aspergillus sclerotialis TaxID=2070753 RepID=A0A3A2ZGW7_9EURO|nr:GNAT family [Aspergillus sclerotialis]